MPRALLSQFENLIREDGSAAAQSPASIISKDDRFIVRYIPFEHVNEHARLVIVGITPGPNQLDLAYSEAQRLLCAGRPHGEVLGEVKRIAGFGGDTMRPNLLRMLRHFGFRDLLGISDEGELWGARTDLLHSTSVVPHATFRRDGRPFAGSFGEVQTSSTLRTSFEQDFVASLSKLRRDALFVGLGPTPLDALKWCAANGLLQKEQIVGAFAHPATTAGSQVAIYLRERWPEDLNPRDPVRHRSDWLISAYDEVAQSINRLREGDRFLVPPLPEVGMTRVPSSSFIKVAREARPTTAGEATCHGLRYIVKRGRGTGTVLTPHKHEDGAFVVSPTRFEADYIRVTSINDVIVWLSKGYSVRMSNLSSSTHRAPSLISPSSIEGL